NRKSTCRPHKTCIFCVNFSVFIYCILLQCVVKYIKGGIFSMRVVTSKSKNAESFYISKGYVNDKGASTSVIVRKLGTLKELLPEHGPTRDDVMAWAREQ